MRPTQMIKISGNVLHHLVHWPSVTFDKKFTEIVPGEFLRRGGVPWDPSNRTWVAK